MAMGNREKRWVIEIQNQINDEDPTAKINLWRKHYIHMLPPYIKDLNSKAYKPRVVSLGPYHNGNPELMPMEEHKHRALLRFMKRAGKPFGEFVSSIEKVVDELQDAYRSLDDKWRQNRDEFMKLMIVDGCFVLEVLRINKGGLEATNDYAADDPIFGNHGRIHSLPYIRGDMLMIENQLPLLVLEKLRSVECPEATDDYYQINKLVLGFFEPGSSARPLGGDARLGLHALEIYRSNLLRGSRRRVRRSSDKYGEDMTIRSATRLNEAGISFKKSRSTSLSDIRFRRGVLSLPVICVDDGMELMFLNLMAFERLHVGAGNDVTSYVFFMDSIINSATDVGLLEEKGIIQNMIGDNEAVAELFNKLARDVTLDPNCCLVSSFEVVYRELHAYCKKRWNRWRADVVRTYFRSPWAFLSLVAAVILLVMTVAQTFYTIYGYYESRDTAAPSPN